MATASQLRHLVQPHRLAALGLIAGTVLYALPSALHGNPPIEDAENLLRYVAERPSWRIVHMVNIAAVLVWLGSLAAAAPLLRSGASALGRAAQAVFTAASGVFAVYFSIHATGLPTLANQLSGQADDAAVFERTESVLVLLGSTAFTAQALLGLAILLYGYTLAAGDRMPPWLGWFGIAVGAGWLLGALVMNFAIIVPFTVLAWAWMASLGVILWRTRSET